MDHFYQMEMIGKSEDPMLEGYTTLGYFAGLTQHVKLGTLVTGVIYRQPGLLIKEVTTLDVLSGGRMYLGIGAAWYEREARGLGFGFPPVKERFERLEETLQIAHQMWSPNNGPFNGKHYQLAETICTPQPLQQPHPPIMIGGSGEKKTLKFIAQYGDACNFFDRIGPDELSRKLDVLKAHCDDVQRPFSEIEVTSLGTIMPGHDSASELLAHLKTLRGLGVTHAIFNAPHSYTGAPLQTLAKDVIPVVAEW
jgi:F420-dependent oxidoreductase-like protein